MKNIDNISSPPATPLPTQSKMVNKVWNWAHPLVFGCSDQLLLNKFLSSALEESPGSVFRNVWVSVCQPFYLRCFKSDFDAVKSKFCLLIEYIKINEYEDDLNNEDNL